jgi:hypothetical protein
VCLFSGVVDGGRVEAALRSINEDPGIYTLFVM